MKSRGRTCSVLIPGCLESAFPLERALGLMEDMHAAGHHASPETYCRIIERLGSKVRALGTQPVELFMLRFLRCCIHAVLVSCFEFHIATR